MKSNFCEESTRSTSLNVFLSCRSSVVQADGVGAGGPEAGGDVGPAAAALWRAAEGRLPELPVHRAQPTGDGHAGVLQSQDPVGRVAVGAAGTRSSGQSTVTINTMIQSKTWTGRPAGGSMTLGLCHSVFRHSPSCSGNWKNTGLI